MIKYIIKNFGFGDATKAQRLKEKVYVL